MSFVSEFISLPLDVLVKKSIATSSVAAREALGKPNILLADFAALISPAAGELLETMGRKSHALTQQRFGKTIRLFAPLYLSNECVNNCSYCGFSRDNPILRVTLSIDEVLREAQALKSQGFRNILLVAGEHPKFVSNHYLRDCVAALHADWPGISLEVGPMETEDYRPLVAAAGTDWSFIRKLTIAKFMRRCTPPDRNGISIGGLKRPNAPMPLVFAGSASRRYMAWLTGDSRRFAWRRTRIFYCAIAGRPR